MRSRFIRTVSSHPEQTLAFLAALVGLVGVASALTPELAGRADLVSGVLPPGLPTAGRVVAIAFGVGLVWLGLGLAARKRRAWQLAVVLLVGIALAHLAKGLDFEEALLSLLVLGLLLLTRHRFDVSGEPLAILPLGLTLVALTLVAMPLVLAEFGALSVPERVNELLWTLTTFMSAMCLQLWFRPWRARRRGSAAERSAAREIVTAHGVDSLDFFSLRHDKSYFFSDDRSAFVAYRVIAGCALISGDPIGEESEFRELLERFREYARGRGWRMGVLAGSETRLPLYRALGLRALKLGDEAIVRAGSFSLEGRAIRKVRNRSVGWNARATSYGSCANASLQGNSASPSNESPRNGEETRPSAASQWRWTGCSATPKPCSSSHSTVWARSVASSTLSRQRISRATR